MAKKIFIITLVLSIISGIITVAFIPLAIDDVSRSLIEYNEDREADKSAITLQSRDNIEKIQILSWYDRVILEKSTDNSMSVTKDQIAVQLSGYLSDKREELHYVRDNVYCIRYANSVDNELALYTRQNAMNTLSAMLENGDNRVLTVYVPEGIEVYLSREPYILENNSNIPVFIDDGSSRSHQNNIEYKSIDPNRANASSNVESSSSIAVVAPPDRHSSTPSSSNASVEGITVRTAEEIRASFTEIMNNHNELYTKFIRGDVNEDYITTELVGTFGTQIEILKTVNVDMYNYLSDQNNYNDVVRCAEFFIEENLLEIKSEMLEDSYKKGLITKADYYTKDLEIDQRENEIDIEKRETSSLVTATIKLRDLERLYGFRIPMLYDID